MSDRSTTRRAVLASLPVPALASLAGCTDVLGDPSTPTPAPLTALEETTVYVDPGLSLSVPDGVPTTDVPGDATVVLVPGDTDRSHSAIVHWLARDAFVAFLGEENQDTWHEIKESDAYAAMLGEPRGRSQACTSSSSGDGHAGGSVSVGGTDSDDCDPPALLVAWATEDPPTATARASWGGTDEPSSRQVFEQLDGTVDRRR